MAVLWSRSRSEPELFAGAGNGAGAVINNFGSGSNMGLGRFILKLVFNFSAQKLCMPIFTILLSRYHQLASVNFTYFNKNKNPKGWL